MFGKKPEPNPKLDELYDKLLKELLEYGMDTDEYPTIVSHLERIEAIRNPKRERNFSWDNVILVGGNLLVVLTIVAYEQKHVFTSKGLSLVRPLKT